MINRELNDHNLDQWLRQNADALPPGEAPVPSAGVWDAVREDLGRRKKRRMLIWWWLIGTAVLSTGAGVYFSRPPQDSDAAKPAFPVVTTEPGNGFPADAAAPSAGTVSKPPTSDAPVRPLIQVAQAGGNPLPLAVFIPEAETADTQTTGKPFPNRVTFFLPDTISLLPVPEKMLYLLPQTVITPAPISGKPSRAFQAGLDVGNYLNNSILVVNENSQPMAGTESGKRSFSFGINFSKQIGRHWGLTTGLQYSEFALVSERVGILRFESEQERFDPSRQQYISTSEQPMETAMGQVTMRYDMGRQAGQWIQNQSVVRVRLTLEERARYWRAPLLLEYRRDWGAWFATCSAGGGINIQAAYTLSVTGSTANRPEIRSVQARALRRQATGTRNVLLDGEAGLFLGRQLGRCCSVRAGMIYRSSLTPMYTNAAYRTYPTWLGGQVSIRYTLKN